MFFNNFYVDKKATFKKINKAIVDLSSYDCGAYNIWKNDSGEVLVDIEWADGVSAFNLLKVLGLISLKGIVTKSELVEYCLG